MTWTMFTFPGWRTGLGEVKVSETLPLRLAEMDRDADFCERSPVEGVW